MRFTRFVLLGLCATLLLSASTHAQESAPQQSSPAADTQTQLRVFDSTNCTQNFPCSGDGVSLSDIASSCIAQGLGFSVPFDERSIDASDCLNAVVGGTTGHSSAMKCCLHPLPDNSTCSMRCSFMAN